MALVGRQLIERAIAGIYRAGRDWVRERRRLRQARKEPDFDRYIEDLNQAGAYYVDHGAGTLGPHITVEFEGDWAELQQRVELEYRFIAQSPGRGVNEIRLRPGPG